MAKMRAEIPLWIEASAIFIASFAFYEHQA
jgi:hypothetical protein